MILGLRISSQGPQHRRARLGRPSYWCRTLPEALKGRTVVSISLSGGSQMTLIGIVVVLVVVGLILWLINTYIPMAGAIKSLLNVVVFVVVLIWLLQVFGLIGPINGVHMPNLK